MYLANDISVISSTEILLLGMFERTRISSLFVPVRPGSTPGQCKRGLMHICNVLLTILTFRLISISYIIVFDLCVIKTKLSQFQDLF